ncbi:MAG: ATP-binding protein [Candidatus Zixiibacteriota bacterium]
MTRRNPTHTIRTGFLYEELWALDYCTKWLAQPDLYQNVQFQTAPSEADAGRFSLDDVVLRMKDGAYELCQVKHRESPERNLWTWDQLLNPEKPRGSSLLKKWSSSYRKLIRAGRISEAFLLTNGAADVTVSRFVAPDGRLRIEDVRGHDGDLYARIAAEVGVDILDDFFAVFRFRFGQSGVDDLASRTISALHGLRATDSGILSVTDQLRKEFGAKFPRAISLDEIRAWCDFDVPRKLVEAFEVPSDFQWFNENTHNQLVEALRAPEGGLQVIVGKPGSGKSTYLSKLHDVLVDKGVVCIRHHYHLAPSDENPQERLPAHRVVEAIKAQFKEHQDAIGSLAWLNSAGVDLREFIAQAAQHFAAAGKAYVFIVDGLDHVPRYESADELQTFLRQVCQPQPGLWILLGMQEVAEPHLPQVVLDKCPKASWIEVPGLTQDAVDAVVRKNEIGLTLPKEPPVLQPLLQRINTLTSGNPLHLRYTLRQLKIAKGTTEVNQFDLDQLLPLNQEIEQYYAALWRQLPALSRTLLVALQVVKERLSETQYLSLATQLAVAPADIHTAYQGIQHLLVVKRTTVETFHNSLEVFVANQPECRTESAAILLRVRHWLEGSTEEYLKWGLLPVVKAELGDHADLFAIDRQWVIDALVRRRPQHTVHRLIEAATRFAFEDGDFAKVYELGSLGGYFESNTDFSRSLADRLWIATLVAERPRAIDTNLKGLRPAQVAAVVRLADQQGELESILDDAIDQINSVHREAEFRRKGDWSNEPPEVSLAIIEVIARDRQHDPQRMLDYCLQFRDLEWSADFLGSYVTTLLRTGQTSTAQWLLRQAFEPDELVALLNASVREEFMQRSAALLDVVKALAGKAVPPSVALYLALHGATEQPPVALPTYDALPDTVPEFDSKSRPARALLFADGVVAAIVLVLRGDSAVVATWLDRAPRRWSVDMFAALLEFATRYGEAIRSSRPLDVHALWQSLASVTPLEWPEDRERLEWQMGMSLVVREVLDTLVGVNTFLGHRVALDVATMAAIVPRAYFGPERMVEYVIAAGRPLLDAQSFRQYIADERTRYPQIMEEFPNRAEHYLDLAAISSMYADDAAQQEFCRRAANCLLGYGSHKDTYIYRVLNAVEYCHAAGSTRTREWLRRLIPIAVHIRKFTDGDELQSVPDALADAMSSVDVGMLCHYWAWACRREEYTLAQTLFSRIVTVANLRDPFFAALAETSLDQESLTALRTRAISEPEAAAAVSRIEAVFGAIVFPKRDQSSSSFKEYGQSDVAAVAPDRLDAHLETLDSYDRQRFLGVWANHWLGASNSQRATAYSILKRRIADTKPELVDSQVLDAVAGYELSLAPESAFTLLTWAQANDRGWDTYWNKPEYAVRRWSIVQQHFPGRHLEFFEKSVRQYDQRPGHNHHVFFPLPRGIEYFARFNELTLIEHVTETAVSFLEKLMADLVVPTPEWIDESQPDAVDLLLARLTSPSPLVRERTATAVAKLLNDQGTRAELVPKLQNWLSNQELETMSALGLLITLKAVLDGTQFPEPELNAILRAVPHSSVAMDELVEELRVRTGLPLQDCGQWAAVGHVRSAYAPSKAILKGMEHGLPPIYREYATIAETSGIPQFTRHWCQVADDIVDHMAIAEPGDDVAYFMGVRHDPRLVAATTQLTEVLKTAFVRVLQHYYTQKRVPEPFLRKWSTSTIPIDLSYWQVTPSRCPAWWPRIVMHNAYSNETRSSVAGIEYQRALEELVGRAGPEIVIGLNGEMLPTAAADIDDTVSVSICMFGFAYDVRGHRLPSATDVAAKVLAMPLVNVNPANPGRCLSFMENHTHHVCMEMESIDIDDLRVFPLVAEGKPWPISTWQWFRGYHPFLMPVPELTPIDSIQPMGNEIEFRAAQRRVAACADWTEGLSDRLVDKHEGHHGTYLVMQRHVVDAWLASNGLRLGFVAKIAVNQQKYRYEEPTEVTDFRLFGVSPIVIPRRR